MRSSRKRVLLGAVSFSLFAVLACASMPNVQHIPSGKKTNITGRILSRNGDLINVKNKKTGQLVVVNVTDSTTFVRKMGTFKFRHADLDVTAMVPGLTIDVEGVGNATGQLDASKISFSPDDFAIDVAEEQQINQRVSDLGDYKAVGEAGIYFATGKSALDDAAKADLSKLADLAMQTQGYIIEVADYASSTATKQVNQQLSQARAAGVTNYLRDAKNVPMRRILVPAGYGATHPAATNTDSTGRMLNQRVDVRILVNTGLSQ